METIDTSRIDVPTYDVDFYSDAVIADPYPHYRMMRDSGPAVWLPQNKAWAITRFVDVRAALRDNIRFISGRGVMLNEPMNNVAAGVSVLTMDDPSHALLRAIMAKPLTPAGLAPIREKVREAADLLVERLVTSGRFDGIADFANYLPLLLISRLVGLPDDGRERMLEWANGIFNAMGSINQRFEAGAIAQQAAAAYLAQVNPADLLPGSWGARLFALAETGDLSEEQARSALFDYVAPALDTTISATGSALWLLGSHPGQWDLLRANPKLVPAAIEEALRLETPIRAFSRYVAEDVEMGDTVIPSGSRALIVYASANRDERHWPLADRFLVERKNPQEQLAFGTGIHMCMGMHLARLEMRCLFEALVNRVERLSVGEPRRPIGNVMRNFASMDVVIEQNACRSEV